MTEKTLKILKPDLNTDYKEHFAKRSMKLLVYLMARISRQYLPPETQYFF